MTPLLKSGLRKESAAAAAFCWLLESGIQDTGTPATFGGMNAWYDLQENCYPFIYAEITGYAVNAYLFLHAVSDDRRYLEAACRAADWLVRSRYPESGLVRTRVNHSNYKVPYFEAWAFTFDQWIMVYGLVSAAQVTKDPRFLNAAEGIAKFLLRETVTEEGLFFPIFDVMSGETLALGDKWSRQPGGFHAKALMGLNKLFELTENPLYHETAERLAAAVLNLQRPDGRFITHGGHFTHMHPHLYALEGLLGYGLARGRTDCIEAAQRGLEWTFKFQQEAGEIPCLYEEAVRPFVRADTLAQALRLGVALNALGRFERPERLEKLSENLKGRQVQSGPQKGGFLYGQEENGMMHPHVNAWVTMFAAQALWWHENGFKTPQPDLSFFV